MPKVMLVTSQEQVALLQYACASNHQTFVLLYLAHYNWAAEYKLQLEFTGRKYLQSVRFPEIRGEEERMMESIYKVDGSDKHCLQP